jgi:hypothetical protein
MVPASCTRVAPPSAPISVAQKPLELVTVYPMSVSEPSGLAYAAATRKLYMVSDGRPEIFWIDTTGKVLGSFGRRNFLIELRIERPQVLTLVHVFPDGADGSLKRVEFLVALFNLITQDGQFLEC